MASLERRSFTSPDTSRRFRRRGHIESITVAGAEIAQATFEPGWHWATDMKPEAGTPSCQEEHTGYILRGRLHVLYDDGQSLDLERGDVFHLPSGHDAWTIGNEACVMIDFAGMVRSLEAGSPRSHRYDPGLERG